MNRILVIGDIHGCNLTFRKLLLDEIQIEKSDTIYCIGDYIDRGPDSKGVIDTILELWEEGFTIHTLRGNHEAIMMNSDSSKENFEQWFFNGGTVTLDSFGIRSFKEMEGKYKNFFKATKFYVKTDEFIFVHAGLNFKNDDPFSDEEAMLWIRDFAVEPERICGRIIIHGHTPKPLKLILNPRSPFLYNIDAGCVYSDRRGQGYLVSIDLTDRVWYKVKNCE